MAGTELHKNHRFFRAALAFTNAETEFSSNLIEKDYFCTLALSYLCSMDDGLVFKGGTCLAKVYAGFYRLSEDLDFAIPMPADTSRRERSRHVRAIKDAVLHISDSHDFITVVEPLNGSNSSTQYIARVKYRSVLADHGTIKIEIGLREPLCQPAVCETVKTILLDPMTGRPALQPVQIRCISLKEAMAEKFRAALTRRGVAIRDFFDIDHAVRSLGFDPTEDDFIELVKQKVAIPGNSPIDISANRLDELKPQRDAQLKPVLRPRDYERFDLDRSLDIVSSIAGLVRA